MKTYGWGNFPSSDGKVLCPSTYRILTENLKSASENSDCPRVIPQGKQKSYGDSALSELMLNTQALNHFIHFDDNQGLLSAQAGVTLGDILKLCIPHAWTLQVSPGTKHVSLGGAIASDVHGKNHHLKGCFSEALLGMKIMLADGTVVNCSRTENIDLFHATCGGMGLTGIILEANIQLQKINSSYLKRTLLKSGSLEETFELIEKNQNVTYSAAWLDCLAKGSSLGRSIIELSETSGQHSDLAVHREAKASIPIHFPNMTLNKLSISAFNYAYYNKQREDISKNLCHYDEVLYPLDILDNWNRIYGKSGFLQYQFVIPFDAGIKGFREILQKISESGMGSMLSVLKLCGEQNQNPLSFPIKGYSLALDFKHGPKVFPLLDLLDSMVENYGGRVYLAKDARLSENSFKKTYANWEKFQEIRHKYGAQKVFNSQQSLRLGL